MDKINPSIEFPVSDNDLEMKNIITPSRFNETAKIKNPANVPYLNERGKRTAIINPTMKKPRR